VAAQPSQPPRERSATLVSGASSGIGLATARRLAERGDRVAMVARAGDVLEREAARLVGEGHLALPADVRDRAGVGDAVAAAVDALGGLDLVVVNAGAATYGRFVATDPDDFDGAVASTFTGAVNVIRSVLPHLERSGGGLVVIGSAADTIPLPFQAGYVAAKHALRGFVETLAIELRAAGSSVAVSLVSPGPVASPFWTNVTEQEEALPPRFPLSYHPDEVARAVCLVAATRRPSLTVGGMTILARAVHTVARPAVDRALAVAARAIPRLENPGSGAAAVREPAGRGEVSLDGLGGRPSALIRLRAAGAGLHRWALHR
jgi:NADP-dependent 3-hydroxy acid dehydrogenase YdfG